MNFDDLAILIQSRMGSTRLPGKSMMKISENTVLEHLLISLKNYFPTKIIHVLTSDSKINKPILSCCDKHKINYESGDEDNVASRFNSFLRRKEIKYFFRICGDTPFFCPSLVLESYREIRDSKQKFDFITSLPNKGNPQGQNIEIFKSNIFLDNYSKFSHPSHFEHVTSYFYQNINSFNYKLKSNKFTHYLYEDLKFSIDEKKDLEFIKKLYSKMKKKPYLYSLEELLEIAYKL